MSRRKDRARTPGLWVATNALPRTGGHPFYQRLNQVLDQHGFDAFVEAQCATFYAPIGRPSLLPATYFRLLLIGYFEGLDSERGIAWRTADSRRCCTNRHEPVRCPPTGSSPADAIRHWSAEGGHPIQDLTAENGLTPLPSWTPGTKAIADDGLVAEKRILHPALTMVP